MAHHKSAKKRIRQTAKRRLRNRYHAKTTRNAMRDLRASKKKSEGEEQLPKVISMVDKLVKIGQFHKNKASNLKSKLTKFVNKLSVEEVKVAKTRVAKKAATTKKAGTSKKK